MSDKTFKQQVEEVCLHYLTLCKCRDDYSPSMVAPELTEAILAAHNAELDRIAEGMQLVDEDYSAQGQLDEDKAYIQAQKGS